MVVVYSSIGPLIASLQSAHASHFIMQTYKELINAILYITLYCNAIILLVINIIRRQLLASIS